MLTINLPYQFDLCRACSATYDSYYSTHLCFPSRLEVRLVCKVCHLPIDRYMFYLVFLVYFYHDFVLRGEHLLRVQFFSCQQCPLKLNI